VRVFQWRKIVNRGRRPTLITSEGAEAPPRQPAREVAEALFSDEAGGQYFRVIPVWLIGTAIIALTLCWQPSWSVLFKNAIAR